MKPYRFGESLNGRYHRYKGRSRFGSAWKDSSWRYRGYRPWKSRRSTDSFGTPRWRTSRPFGGERIVKRGDSKYRGYWKRPNYQSLGSLRSISSPRSSVGRAALSPFSSLNVYPPQTPISGPSKPNLLEHLSISPPTRVQKRLEQLDRRVRAYEKDKQFYTNDAKTARTAAYVRLATGVAEQTRDLFAIFASPRASVGIGATHCWGKGYRCLKDLAKDTARDFTAGKLLNLRKFKQAKDYLKPMWEIGIGLYDRYPTGKEALGDHDTMIQEAKRSEKRAEDAARKLLKAHKERERLRYQYLFKTPNSTPIF